MYCLIGLDTHEDRHGDAANLADSAQIVAQQVDDHHMFRAILLACAQRLAGGVIGIRGIAASGRAFDGPGFHMAVAINAQEALR